MFKKIVSTIATRGILAILNFVLAIITARYLGPTGKGDVSLFVLNLTIVQLINNFIGGSYLVYLIPRKNFMQLFLLAYAWSLFTAIAVPYGLFLFNLLDPGQVLPLMIISFLFSLFAVNTMIFIAKEEINKYNIVALLQISVLMIAFIFYIEKIGIKNITSYIHAMYFSTGIAFAISFILITKYMHTISLKNIITTFYETISKGFTLQIASAAQLLSYRLSFYILNYYYVDGRKEVGIYSVAVSVAEALWLISQSVSLVLYSKISNINDIAYARNLTLSLIKIVFIITFFSASVLLCFPSSIFVFIFGEGFGQVRSILFPLSIGIVIFSAGIILSSYFVGLGKPQVCVIASVIGLAVTITLCFLLIPKYGMIGAAISASASYISGVSYQLYKFIRESGELTFRDFIFSKNDLRFITLEIKNVFAEKKTV